MESVCFVDLNPQIICSFRELEYIINKKNDYINIIDKVIKDELSI